MKPRQTGSSNDVTPKSCTETSAVKAPTGPMKLCVSPAGRSLKNHTGSVWLAVTNAIIQPRQAANSATPTNSFTRRDRADSAKMRSSDFHHDRQHERSPPGPFAKQSLHFQPQALFQQA